MGHVVTGNLSIVEKRKLLTKARPTDNKINDKVDARTLDEWEIKVVDSIHIKIHKKGFGLLWKITF